MWLLMFAAAASGGSNSLAPWATFSRAMAFEPTFVQVEIGTACGTGHTNCLYWFRRSVISRNSAAKAVDWTDTRRCPAALQVIEEMATVPPPTIKPPRIDGKAEDIIITADGGSYVLESSARYDRTIGPEIKFSSNVGTPLAKWVDRSLSALNPCWSATPTQVANLSTR